MGLGTIEIVRVWQDTNQTSGTCTIYDENNFPLFVALSLERGWRNNEQNVSCIPVGEYEMKLEHSPRFKKLLWEIKGVQGRSECKFHSANYWFELNGCISLGLKHKKINKDNYYDVTNSRKTMQVFHDVLSNFKEVKLIIKNSEALLKRI